MNFLQLVNRYKLECGVTGADLVTTASQIGEYARLVTWINQAWLDIQNVRSDWGWMRKTATFQTASHKPTYSLSDIGITDFGFWMRDTFRNYSNPQVTVSIASPAVVTLAGHNLSVGDTVVFFTTGALPTGMSASTVYYVQSVLSSDTFAISATSGGAAINTSGTQSGTHTMTSNNTSVFAGMKSEIFMGYVDYEEWRDTYLYGALRTVTTRPVAITVTPDKSLGLGPVSIDGYTVLGDYYSSPSSMVNDADTPAMPSQYHMLIVYTAMLDYGFFEAAAEVIQRAEKKRDTLLRHLVSSRTPTVQRGGPLA